MLWCGPRRPSPSDVLYLATTKCSGYGDSVSTFSIIAEYRTKVMREGKDVWIFMFSHFRLGSVPKGNVWFFFFFTFFHLQTDLWRLSQGLLLAAMGLRLGLTKGGEIQRENCDLRSVTKGRLWWQMAYWGEKGSGEPRAYLRKIRVLRKGSWGGLGNDGRPCGKRGW